MYKYVLVAPICATPPHLYGLSVGDKADIPCNVAANPTQVHYQPHTGSLSTPLRFIINPTQNGNVIINSGLVTTYGTLPEHQHVITIINTIVIIIIVVLRTLCSTGFSIPPPTSKTSSTCLPYQGPTTALKSSLF